MTKTGTWALVLLALSSGLGGCGGIVIVDHDRGDTTAVGTGAVTSTGTGPAPLPSGTCAGQPPGVDSDGDGTPDACDPCPFDGPRAAVPNGSTAHPAISIANMAFASTGRSGALVQAGASVTFSLTYTINDCVCPGCTDQIEIGTVPGGPLTCAYSGGSGCGATASGPFQGSFTAPTKPGVYDVRFGLRQDYSCSVGQTPGWWQGEPGAERTIGKLCVQ